MVSLWVGVQGLGVMMATTEAVVQAVMAAIESTDAVTDEQLST